MIPVVLPEMGESVSEGSITGWRKAVGDRVQAGEAIVDVTTDKVDVEVPSPATGTLKRIVAADGATVAVGGVLAEISPDGDGEAQPAPPNSEPPKSALPKPE